MEEPGGGGGGKRGVCAAAGGCFLRGVLARSTLLGLGTLQVLAGLLDAAERVATKPGAPPATAAAVRPERQQQEVGRGEGEGEEEALLAQQAELARLRGENEWLRAQERAEAEAESTELLAELRAENGRLRGAVEAEGRKGVGAVRSEPWAAASPLAAGAASLSSIGAGDDGPELADGDDLFEASSHSSSSAASSSLSAADSGSGSGTEDEMTDDQEEEEGEEEEETAAMASEMASNISHHPLGAAAAGAAAAPGGAAAAGDLLGLLPVLQVSDDWVAVPRQQNAQRLNGRPMIDRGRCACCRSGCWRSCSWTRRGGATAPTAPTAPTVSGARVGEAARPARRRCGQRRPLRRRRLRPPRRRSRAATTGWRGGSPSSARRRCRYGRGRMVESPCLGGCMHSGSMGAAASRPEMPAPRPALLSSPWFTSLRRPPCVAWL
jgi:hypothetical protein